MLQKARKKRLEVYFLWLSLAVAVYFTYVIFSPFWGVILFSAIIVTIFYPYYQKLLVKMNNKKNLAALLMTIIIFIIIIIPLILFLVYTGQKSLEAYGSVQEWFNQGQITDVINKNNILYEQYHYLSGILGDQFDLKKFLVDTGLKINSFIIDGVKAVIKGTGNFILNVIFAVLTIFFLFRDGDKIANKLMQLTPLRNKYDKEIFNKFRDVSYSALVSEFITALAQGAVGSVAFVILGLPGAFFAFILMTFASFLPYVGSLLVWGPVGVYLLLIGEIGQGIFMLLWGAIVVGSLDNFLRPFLMKGRTEIHSLLLFFAILGGIYAFGFIGVFIGPFIIAILITLLHLYELEYKGILEK